MQDSGEPVATEGNAAHEHTGACYESTLNCNFVCEECRPNQSRMQPRTVPTVSNFSVERISEGGIRLKFTPSTVGNYGYEITTADNPDPAYLLILSIPMSAAAKENSLETNIATNAARVHLQIADERNNKSQVYSLDIPAYTPPATPTVSGLTATRTAADRVEYKFTPSISGVCNYELVLASTTPPTLLNNSIPLTNSGVEYSGYADIASASATDALKLYLQIADESGTKSQVYELDIPAHTPLIAPTVSNFTVDRISESEIRFTFTPSAVGEYGYMLTSVDTQPPTEVTRLKNLYGATVHTNRVNLSLDDAKLYLQTEDESGNKSIIYCMEIPAYMPPNIVTTAAELKTALQAGTPETINVTADFTITEVITVGASHTLSINSGVTLTAGQQGGIRVGTGKALTIHGGGTLRSVDTNNILHGGGAVNFENVTVQMRNASGGISNVDVTVGNGAKIILDSPTSSTLLNIPEGRTITVNTGGNIEVKNYIDAGINVFDTGVLHINGGTVHIAGVGTTSTEFQERGRAAAGINMNQGKLKISGDGQITSVSDGVIWLFEKREVEETLYAGSKLEGVSGLFRDGSYLLNNNSEVEVGDTSTNQLTSGDYLWNGTLFAQGSASADAQTPTITKQPQSATVCVGQNGVVKKSAVWKHTSYKIPEYSWSVAERRFRYFRAGS